MNLNFKFVDYMSHRTKKRLDVILVERKLAVNRSKANQLIQAGQVKANHQIIRKSGQLIAEGAIIEIQPSSSYVSRGGLKLEAAIKHFGINVADKICLDVGASTGGFTDCLLKYGARLVYAVDVGENQLHPALKKIKKVICCEKTDIRDFYLPNNTKIDLICIDVSFISSTLILSVIKKFLASGGEVIVLIKPQFEVGKKNLKKGIVKNEKAATEVINNIIKLAQQMGFIPKGIITSSIKGKKGNQEYFLYLKLANKKRLF